MTDFGMNFNASCVIRSDGYTSVGVKMEDTEGLDIDVSFDGEDVEEVVQKVVQSTANKLISHVATHEEEETKLELPEEEDEDDFWSSEDDDDYLPCYFDYLIGDIDEESYGGFDSWEDERESLLNDLEKLSDRVDELEKENSDIRSFWGDREQKRKAASEKIDSLLSDYLKGIYN